MITKRRLKREGEKLAKQFDEEFGDLKGSDEYLDSYLKGILVGLSMAQEKCFDMDLLSSIYAKMKLARLVAKAAKLVCCKSENSDD